MTDGTTALARDVWQLFGCRGFARVDLMRDDAGGELCVLEVNSVPGLTETSLLPQAVEAAGEDPSGLYRALVERATGEQRVPA